MIGIRTLYRLASDQSLANSAVLQNLPGLSFPVVAGQRYHIKMWSIISELGGAAGVKFFLSTPATSYILSEYIFTNCVSVPGFFADFPAQNANIPAFGVFANNGLHKGEIEADFILSATGVVNVQWAQGVADPNATIILQGAIMEVILY